MNGIKKEFKYCPICGKLQDKEIIDVCTESYKYLIDKIKKDHPDWIEKDGACPKCVEYYKTL